MRQPSVEDFHEIAAFGKANRRHILSTLGDDIYPPDLFCYYSGPAYVIHDRRGNSGKSLIGALARHN